MMFLRYFAERLPLMVPMTSHAGTFDTRQTVRIQHSCRRAFVVAEMFSPEALGTSPPARKTIGACPVARHSRHGRGAPEHQSIIDGCPVLGSIASVVQQRPIDAYFVHSSLHNVLQPQRPLGCGYVFLQTQQGRHHHNVLVFNNLRRVVMC